jgi:hypothetical protein
MAVHAQQTLPCTVHLLVHFTILVLTVMDALYYSKRMLRLVLGTCREAQCG